LSKHLLALGVNVAALLICLWVALGVDHTSLGALSAVAACGAAVAAATTSYRLWQVVRDRHSSDHLSSSL